MFGAFLHRLCQEGKLTIDQIAAAWKIEPSSVYPYFQDRWPTLDRWLVLMERATPDVQRDLIAFALKATPRWIATRIEPSQDINGDGVVDADDAIAMAIESADDAMGLVKATHEAAGDRKLTVSEIDALLRHRDEALNHLAAYGELLMYLRRHATQRRKCVGTLTATARGDQ